MLIMRRHDEATFKTHSNMTVPSALPGFRTKLLPSVWRRKKKEKKKRKQIMIHEPRRPHVSESTVRLCGAVVRHAFFLSCQIVVLSRSSLSELMVSRLIRDISQHFSRGFFCVRRMPASNRQTHSKIMPMFIWK